MRFLVLAAVLAAALLAGCSGKAADPDGPAAAAPSPAEGGTRESVPDAQAYDKDPPEPVLQTLQQPFGWTAGAGWDGHDTQVQTSNGISFEVRKPGTLRFEIAWRCDTPAQLCELKAFLCPYGDTSPFGAACEPLAQGPSRLAFDVEAADTGAWDLVLTSQGMEANVVGSIALEGYVENLA